MTKNKEFMCFAVLCFIGGLGIGLSFSDMDVRLFLSDQREIPYKCHILMEFLEVEEADQCLTWALGEDWESLAMSDIPHQWNSRHGDKFVLYGYDIITEGNKRMYAAWKNYQENL